MSPLYRNAFNSPHVVVTQKLRSRALSSTGTEVDSFPVYVVTLLTQAPLFFSILSGGLCFSCPLYWNQEQGELAIRLIQAKHCCVRSPDCLLIRCMKGLRY